MTQTPDERPQWTSEILNEINKLRDDQSRVNDRLDTYQRAADRITASSERVANLAFTVVTASAAVVVLAPAVKELAEFLASTMTK